MAKDTSQKYKILSTVDSEGHWETWESFVARNASEHSCECVFKSIQKKKNQKVAPPNGFQENWWVHSQELSTGLIGSNLTRYIDNVFSHRIFLRDGGRKGKCTLFR